jgi:hypothetical protein
MGVYTEDTYTNTEENNNNISSVSSICVCVSFIIYEILTSLRYAMFLRMTENEYVLAIYTSFYHSEARRIFDTYTSSVFVYVSSVCTSFYTYSI